MSPTSLLIRITVDVIVFFFSIVGFITIAGGLSLLAQRKETKRKYHRAFSDAEYLRKYVYHLSWGALYYFKPLYSFVLAVTPLKRYAFRLFGYRGSIDFTVSPSTWIKDLTLLSVGEKTMLSSRATLGSSIQLTDNTIFSDRITIDPSVSVGPLCILGPGARLLKGSELGTSVAVGIRSRIGTRTRVGSFSMISHGVTVGENTLIGDYTFAGVRTSIPDRVLVPPGMSIPSGTQLTSQHDVDKLRAGEARLLQETARTLMSKLNSEMKVQTR